MWRAFWGLAAVCAVFAGFLAWASESATFLFVHPRAPGVRIVIDHETGVPVVVEKANAVNAAGLAAEQRQGTLEPKVQANELAYDFGIMDPLTTGKHEFVLRNVGATPLALTVGPTTCKCTVSGLDKREVVPGDSATVTLEWHTGRSILYSHAATIYTSDPDRPSLEVRVSGKVRMQLGADVEELVMPDVDPMGSAAAECFLYSQVWDDLEILAVESQLPDLTWEITKTEPGQVPDLSAKAVQRLRIVIPAAGLPRRFSDTLHLQARVPGADEPHTFDLPLAGNVLGRYTFYGGDIVDGGVEFGSVPWGQRRNTKLLIKVRDADLDLGQVKVELTPSFLRAKLEPQVGSARGLYALYLELPAQSPVCQYLGRPQGEVKVVTEHPRIGTIRFPVRFAVLDRQD